MAASIFSWPWNQKHITFFWPKAQLDDKAHPTQSPISLRSMHKVHWTIRTVWCKSAIQLNELVWPRSVIFFQIVCIGGDRLVDQTDWCIGDPSQENKLQNTAEIMFLSFLSPEISNFFLVKSLVKFCYHFINNYLSEFILVLVFLWWVTRSKY
jgi:hypothetical protein